MTTRLRASRDYPHDLVAFAAAIADPAFHAARLDDGSGGEVVSHRVDGDTVEVRLRQPVPTPLVPAVITRLLSDALVLFRTERWTLGPDACRGAVEVVVPRAPVRAEGSMLVDPAGTGCRLEVDVGVTVTVPFAGALVEPAVVEGIRNLTGVEHDQISAWLARHDGAGRGGTGGTGGGA